MATSVGTTSVKYGSNSGASRPEVLIERWLPVDLVGAESMRERGASSALPALYFLHVWWARRPLTASRAAILGSVLPAWRDDWPEHLKARFPTEASYRRWFIELCGVYGDSVLARKLLAWARDQGRKIPNPYTSKRAFSVSPSKEQLAVMGELLSFTWGSANLSVLDSFAGGGSIPFEAMRYGFSAYANELNPVASVVLKATLDYPARFGPDFASEIRKWGSLVARRVQERLKPFYTDTDGEHRNAAGVCYIWARTVACPYTGKLIPLTPNWWLAKGSEPLAVKAVYDSTEDTPRFELVRGATACQRINPDRGTVSRGNAVSPWSGNQIVDGDYIKGEAQAGRMGHVLYAVGVKRTGGFDFRAPTAEDMECFNASVAELAAQRPRWEALDLLPTEEIPDGNKTSEPRRYGMSRWMDMYSPRQLLALTTLLEEIKAVQRQVRAELPPEQAEAVSTYLGFLLDKSADRNSLMSRWVPQRGVLANTFDRHDFAFKWSYGEFDASRNMVPWTVEQVADAYAGIAKLAQSDGSLFKSTPREAVRVIRGSAARIDTLSDASMSVVCVDPPYYDNVMYAECSDFFYVWLKRSVGDVHPQLFADELTNKDDEAVANPARFAALGKKKKELAAADYERKMMAAFREMHRVLRDDGVLTVMFTHKKVEAWDTLAASLIGAGFAIHSSLPVHTEFAHSLHVARKNAAESTILLSCRKREARAEPVWWDDLKGRVRQVAREKAAEFEAQGIRGVDLYIATFGPTLAILSENWPVLTSEVDERTGEPKPLRPEVALELARQEVVNLRKQGLLLGRAVQFDPYTDWYLMAWDAFRAEEFPADEARKLAIALGLDLERQVIAEKRLVAKKTSSVVLQKPEARRGATRVDADRETFEHVVDAVHTAMWVFEEDGAAACEAFLRRTGLRMDAAFKACVQAMLNAIPRTKQKGKFVRPEAEVLEGMRLAFFDDLTVPVDEEIKLVEEQLQFLCGGGASGEEEMENEEEGDEDVEE